MKPWVLLGLLSVGAHAADPEVAQWCDLVAKGVQPWAWRVPTCPVDKGAVKGHSQEGRPLVVFDFGDPNAKNATLVLSMVHGDESTPLYAALQLLDWLQKHESEFPGHRIVVAPMVNPDGFFKEKKTRVNAKGVDLNRNFLTKDWNDRALLTWKKRLRSDPRRFPGNSAESEPETVFQKDLIASVQPTKILSIHAPLGFMDYDGPDVLTLAKFPRGYVRKCLELRASVRAVSGGFYPGSLGNYAGQERGIPTLTLELPSANPKLAETYWRQFQEGIETVIRFEMPPDLSAQERLAGAQSSR